MYRIRKYNFLLLPLIVLFVIGLGVVGCSRLTGQESSPDTASDTGDHVSNQPTIVQEDTSVAEPDLVVSPGGTSQPADEHDDSQDLMPEVAPSTANVAGTEQQDDATDAQLKQETRAIWSWAGVRATSKKEIDQMVARVVDEAHMNVILLLVYAEGTAYFEPSYTRFPNSAERLSNMSEFSDDGYSDALSYLVAVRDKRQADDDPTNDFEVQPWFNINSGGRMADAWPPIDKTEPYMLNALFPEFKLKVGAAYIEDDDRYAKHNTSVVQQPKYRAYMTDLIAGIVEDYDVDGVHLDYIRTGGICFNDEALDYPGTEYDYPGCQEDYKAWTRETYGQEYSLWEDTDGFQIITDGDSGRVAAWLEHNVGLLVESIHDEVKSVSPETIITMAALSQITPQEKDSMFQGQVAWEWLDQGWVDAAFIMAYGPVTGWIPGRIELFRDATQIESSRSKIFPGLVTHNLKNTKEFWSYLIAEQIRATMRGQWEGQPLEPPAKGVALFLEHRLSDEAIEILAEGPFKEPAVPYWGE